MNEKVLKIQLDVASKYFWLKEVVQAQMKAMEKISVSSIRNFWHTEATEAQELTIAEINFSCFVQMANSPRDVNNDQIQTILAE